MSPTARTLKYLRDAGYTCEVVERWNQYARIRQDLFNFIDIVALGNGEIIAIQATSGSNHAARRTKIDDEPLSGEWFVNGGSIVLISWRKIRSDAILKNGKRSSRKVWKPIIERKTLAGWSLWAI